MLEWIKLALGRIRLASDIKEIIIGGLVLFAVLGTVLEYGEKLLKSLEAHDYPVIATVIAIASVIAFATLVIYIFVLKYKYGKIKQRLRVYIACEEVFRLSAPMNAACDALLFDRLHYDLAGRLLASSSSAADVKEAQDAFRSAGSSSLAIIDGNIQKTLTTLADLTKKITRCSDTAVALKLLAADGSRQIFLEARDDASSLRRPSAVTNSLDDTPFSDVFSRDRDHFVFNNLKRWSESNTQRYRDNEHHLLAEPYNAILVVPILSLKKIDGRIATLGFLQIDNQKGGLSDPRCISYAAELSYRVAVMTYRASLLRAQSAR